MQDKSLFGVPCGLEIDGRLIKTENLPRGLRRTTSFITCSPSCSGDSGKDIILEAVVCEGNFVLGEDPQVKPDSKGRIFYAETGETLMEGVVLAEHGCFHGQVYLVKLTFKASHEVTREYYEQKQAVINAR